MATSSTLINGHLNESLTGTHQHSFTSWLLRALSTMSNAMNTSGGLIGLMILACPCIAEVVIRTIKEESGKVWHQQGKIRQISLAISMELLFAVTPLAITYGLMNVGTKLIQLHSATSELIYIQNKSVRCFALTLALLTGTSLVAVSWSFWNTYFIRERLYFAVHTSCVWILGIAGYIWIVSFFASAELCGAACTEVCRKLSDKETFPEARQQLVLIHEKVIPLIQAGWSNTLLFVTAMLLQFALISGSLHYAGGLPDALAGDFLIALFAVLILLIPAKISSHCEACLAAVNCLGLREPSLHRECKVLEQRLTGGCSNLPQNSFGFSLFGLRVSAGLLKSAAASLISVAAVVLQMLGTQ